jgi:hypothetical protein
MHIRNSTPSGGEQIWGGNRSKAGGDTRARRTVTPGPEIRTFLLREMGKTRMRKPEGRGGITITPLPPASLL